MSLETMTQTEVKDPPYSKIAEAILSIGEGAKEQGHDQETIRVMIHTFSQAASAVGHASSLGMGINDAKRHY